MYYLYIYKIYCLYVYILNNNSNYHNYQRINYTCGFDSTVGLSLKGSVATRIFSKRGVTCLHIKKLKIVYFGINVKKVEGKCSDTQNNSLVVPLSKGD